jgi:Cu2+-exporting ATPase
MEKRMQVEGMMCPRCEARVQKALEALPGVEKAVADHEANRVTVTLSTPVADEVLTETVQKAGYTVTGVQLQ